MELKKTVKADLEYHKTTFILTGFVITLSLILLAFEWTSSTKLGSDLGNLEDIEMEEIHIPITREEIKPPPPPPPPPPKIEEEIKIVKDDVEVKEDVEINTEANEETEIQIIEVEEEEEVEESTLFHIVEQMPEFPGGLQKYLAKNIKYPEIAKENDIQGKVYVNFVVNEKGEVEQVKIIRGVDRSLDKEALRVVRSLPNWNAGRQRGRAVRVSINIPIIFKLQ